ncbi:MULTISPECIES: helix-hairpin-helix domain-containing protein [unclassified Caballeronia]|uniref:ComEA family DNA-binding protein n=1 Tax=unclassified Caballeronia TaxID=2646786 RepID=UPI002027FC55|nr:MULTISPECIES: helix-hairpin-helix domain-containing protein [unclassified Caballeronia]MDR5765372.1 helix-hairpin-helix domain-containing protein [Caballeronia sp. LZ028]
MLKKLLMLCFAFVLSMGAAFAAVDVNTADQAALESVKGLGPVKSKAIIDERTKNGPFKDADDLATRVKGLGAKSVTNLEQNGLTIGGSSLPPTGKPSKPATPSTQGGSAAPNSTVKSSTAATGATSPAATTAQTPATTPATPASGTKASKKSKRDSAASAAASASSPSAASEAKPAQSKRSKKDKAASAAAASQ